MSKAAELAALIGSQTALSNRNLIINGAMQVAQRGTSETGITGSEYANAPDRFKAQITTAGTWTLSQSSTAPDGFANSYKWDCTTADASLAAGDVIQFAHKVEAQNLQQLQYGTSGAQAVTVSFYVRSNKTGTYILEIYQDDGARGISKSYTIDSADTWERKTITIPGDSSGSINDDNGIGFDMLWYLAAGTNFTSGTLATDWASLTSANRAVGQVNLADSTSNEWYITGIQLELGEQETPFEHRSYGDELLRCQRYFEGGTRANSSHTGSAGLIWTQKNDSSSRTFPQMNAEYKVLKRATPTVTIESGQDGTANRISGYSSGINYTVTAIQSPSPSYVCSYIQTTGSLPDQITTGYYTADAEL